MEASGRNRTPDKLPALERAALQALCDEALRDTVAELEPRRVIGVGRFAEQRAAEALRGLGVPVGRILHPSPASPAANRAWVETIERELAAQDVSLSDLPG
jgi:single-strand selective monofunctional uracil DNA glycosylase